MKRISEIAQMSAGYPSRGRIPEVNGSGVIAIQMKNTSKLSGIDWGSCIETESPLLNKKPSINAEDILFTAKGVNNYALMVGDIPQGKSAIASPHFFVITLTNKEVFPRYLVWLLNQKRCQRYFQRKSEGSLTKSIRRNVLENTPITIPSLQQQKSIINLAKTLEQEQQILNKIIHNGETTMNAIANDLFTSDTIV